MLGLQVTGIGMALVFLTLIIVMFAVWLLSWAFRPTSGEAPAAAKVQGPESTPANTTSDGAAMAAAIAVAIARRQRRAGTTRAPKPAVSWAYESDEIIGEVVYVAQIDTDSGAWQSQSRLSAVK